MTPEEGGYLLPNRHAAAGARLAALATLFDPSTFGHVECLGIAPGWDCWEVGAGGPGVPRWLAEQVGPGGSVLATDIDVSRLGDVEPDVVVRRHDIGADPPPAGPFDLVHARLVLTHVPQRARAVAAMAGVLRPGGWLLIEDADPSLQPLICLDEVGPEEALANRLRAGFRHLLVARGADLAVGRTLPRLLRSAGLVDVRADAYFPVTSPANVALEAATIAQVHEELVAGGLATEDEIDTHLQAVAAGRLDLATSPMISAWGRRPSEGA
jgi:SAM-dependent methyltransferase